MVSRANAVPLPFERGLAEERRRLSGEGGPRLGTIWREVGHLVVVAGDAHGGGGDGVEGGEAIDVLAGEVIYAGHGVSLG